MSLRQAGVGHPRGHETAGVTASGHVSELMSGVVVAYAMGVAFILRFPHFLVL